MPTMRSSSAARAMRSAGRDSGRCALMTSVSCAEILCTGLSEFIAPWNTIDTCCQRKARSSAGVIDSTSSARPSRSCHSTWPPATMPGGGSSRVMP